MYYHSLDTEGKDEIERGLQISCILGLSFLSEGLRCLCASVEMPALPEDRRDGW